MPLLRTLWTPLPPSPSVPVRAPHRLRVPRARTHSGRRWFGYLTDQTIRRGVHKSVQALEKDIRAWIQTWNENPRPFIWKKTAEEILDSLAKYIARISGASH